MNRLFSFFGAVCLLMALALFSPSGTEMPVPGKLAAGRAEAAVTVTPTPQLPQVIIRENFIQQASKCINEILADNGETKRYTITPVSVPAGLRLPWGEITYRSYAPNGIRKGLNSAIFVEVLVNGEHYATMKCIMKVRFFGKVVTSARRIQHEVPLSAEDLRVEEREDKGGAYATYASPQELIGKVLSSNIGEGTVLHSGMVREPILIQPYAVINICTVFNGVEIKVPGTALETGRRGAYISVKNNASGRKVRAKVVDENNVMVVQ
ncbi:MAG: flagellar basal body P-ring formation chaperone FlgA [Selenomonadaceae bacterium]|nr:flagellar basal body P-ring formation chaperone FlgA [Selenomonadaceae bacterium]